MIFGVKMHKEFPRKTRDVSDTCGSGIFPANDHKGKLDNKTETLYGQGIDMLVMMSAQCDEKCFTEAAYKQDKYSTANKNQKATAQGGTAPPPPPPTGPQDKWVQVPFKGEGLK